jgi:hypothetical protein
MNENVARDWNASFLVLATMADKTNGGGPLNSSRRTNDSRHLKTLGAITHFHYLFQ